MGPSLTQRPGVPSKRESIKPVSVGGPLAKRYRSTSLKPNNQPDARVRGNERLTIVDVLLEQGWSQREIAKELGWDEAVIRRDIEKLSLPKGELAAIQSGDTAERYLNEARFRKTGVDRAAAAKQRRRLSQEKRDGRHSTSLSVAILNWLAKKDLLTDQEQLILVTAQQEIDVSKDHWGPPIPNLAGMLQQSERGDLPDDPYERISFYVDALVCALTCVEPTTLIRQLALQKSIQAILAAERKPKLPERWKKEYARIKARRV